MNLPRPLRTIARAAVTIENQPPFDGTREEVVEVIRYDDDVVRVEVEHYDGARAIDLDPDTWRAFRAAIIADAEKEVTPEATSA